MKLKLTKDVVIDFADPNVAVDGIRAWIVASAGSGKSNASMLILSQWVKQGGQALVLDAHGEYGALWEARPRDVIRIGYGEEPVREESVELCCYHLREGRTLLVDLSHWTDIHQDILDVFVNQLMKAVYEMRRKKATRMLVLVEEASNFVGQSTTKTQYPNLQLFKGMLGGGRKFGLNFILASQKQALVDSSVIGLCNVRIFMRLSDVTDFAAVRKFLPPKFPIDFGSRTKKDIMRFKHGEAVLVSAWDGVARVQLPLPEVKVKKFLPEGG